MVITEFRKFTARETPQVAMAATKFEITKPAIVDSGRVQISRYIKAMEKNESGKTINGRLLTTPATTRILKVMPLAKSQGDHSMEQYLSQSRGEFKTTSTSPKGF